jgi:hypothetical protein
MLRSRSTLRPVCTALVGVLVVTLLPAWELVGAAPAAQAVTPVSFTRGDLVGSSEGTRHSALGDLDGDGALDLVVQNDGGLRLYFNNGSADPFNAVVGVALAEASFNQFSGLALGDLDNDGDLDLVAGRAVYRNEGPGKLFGAGAALTLPGDEAIFTSLALGDVDGDGYLDIVGRGGRTFRSQGGQSFAEPSGPSADVDGPVALGDLDRDGDLDLVAGGGRLVVRNDGNLPVGGAALPTLLDPAARPWSMTLGDLNGDTFLDLVVAGRIEPPGGPESRGLAVLLSRGANELFAGVSPFYLAGTTYDAAGVSLGDLNGDGSLDIVLGNVGSEPRGRTAELVFLNTGSPEAPFAGVTPDSLDGSASGTLTVAVGDLNGDGALDIFAGNRDVGNGFDGTDRIYLNNARPDPLNLTPRPFPPGRAVAALDIALGDLDADGSLDIVLGTRGEELVYLSRGPSPFTSDPAELPGSSATTLSVELATLNGDDALDLITIGPDGAQYHLNNGDGSFGAPVPVAGSPGGATLAVGDLDGDGDLDLVAGTAVLLSGGPSARFTGAARSDLAGAGDVSDVALGDLDGDGDLDLAAATSGPELLYLNNGTARPFEGVAPQQIAGSEDRSQALALGDLDGDGDLDLITGNRRRPARYYLNNGSAQPFAGVAGAAVSDEQYDTADLALGDFDRDGDLDLVTANRPYISAEENFFGRQDRLYLNNGTASPFASVAGRPLNESRDPTEAVALGDLNGDNYLDVVLGEIGGRWIVYNQIPAVSARLANRPPIVRVGRPDGVPAGGRFASAEILAERLIRVPYTLSDPDFDRVRFVRGSFSLDGGSTWRPAAPANPAQNVNLAAGPAAVAHTFVWDTAAGGANALFGQSDTVLFRIEAAGGGAGDGQAPFVGGDSPPFRARGTTARVLDTAGGPVPGATVYRLPAGQLRGATQLPNWLTREPLGSGAQGFVASRGAIRPGDTLVAARVISESGKLTFLHMSDPVVVAAPGAQNLAVTPARPLLLFNLAVSLEWDARGDERFLGQLQDDLRRTSELLYDWTDGQMALGALTLHHDREAWETADIQIHASNRLRPNATQGGITTSTITETYTVDGAPRTVVYEPGQVRMGSTWNRFGDPGRRFAEDWPRALAHELGHYLLYLDETYLGLQRDQAAGRSVLINVSTCPSPMSDPYADFEFRARGAWEPACAETLTNRSTGLSEWELIKRFYDRPVLGFVLNAPASVGVEGPATLPLAVTVVREQPAGPTATLPDTLYALAGDGGGRVEASAGADVFLFRRAGGAILDLGAPLGDQVEVRGAAAGDRLCVFDPAAGRLGCGEISQSNLGLSLRERKDWRPEVRVTAPTSRSLALEIPVAGVGAPEPASLRARLFVLDEEAVAAGVGSPEVVLTPGVAPDGSRVFGGTFTLTTTVTSGFLHVWAPDDAAPRREIVAEYALGGNPAPRKRSKTRNKRRAPAVSPDGQATVFADDVTFGPGQYFALQPLTALPSPPPWASVVGQGYRLFASDPALLARPLSLSISYAEGEAPPGLETSLQIYFFDGAAWRPLPTVLDARRNEAATSVQPQPGSYALLAGLRLELPEVGWNLIGAYPGADQELPAALQSIAGGYSHVFAYSPGDDADPWAIFAPDAPAWVSDLGGLEEGRGYWIHTLRPLTARVRSPADAAAAGEGAITALPPSTVYGVLTPSVGFTPRAGVPVEAYVGETMCGQATTREVGGGQFGFVVDVNARGGGDDLGCGTPGATITLRFNGPDGAPLAEHTTIWNSAVVRRVFLGPWPNGAPNVVFLPQTAAGAGDEEP